MSAITIPDFIFPAIVHSGIEPKIVTILVYTEDRPTPMFTAWFHNQGKSSSITVYQQDIGGEKKWNELLTGKETVMSKAIGLAIENNYQYL